MSTSLTATPPAWLEAAAKLDKLSGEKVPLSSMRDDEPEGDEEESEAEFPREEPNSSANPIAVARPEPAKSAIDSETARMVRAESAKGLIASETARVARPESAKGVDLATTPFADSGRATQTTITPRPRITPPAVISPTPASTEEVELAWQGYSIRALLPSTIALAAVTVSAIVLLRPLVPTWMVHEAGDAPLAAIWLLQAIRAGYRLFGYNYRLTTRRLFHDRGRLYPPDAPLDLATVVRVEVKQSLLGRLIGVGTVRVIPEEASATVELTGVCRPKALTAKIEAAATAARAANVSVGRVRGEPEN